MSQVGFYYGIPGCDSYNVCIGFLGCCSIRLEAQNEEQLDFRWLKSRSNYPRRRQVPVMSIRYLILRFIIAYYNENSWRTIRTMAGDYEAGEFVTSVHTGR